MKDLVLSSGVRGWVRTLLFWISTVIAKVGHATSISRRRDSGAAFSRSYSRADITSERCVDAPTPRASPVQVRPWLDERKPLAYALSDEQKRYADYLKENR